MAKNQENGLDMHAFAARMSPKERAHAMHVANALSEAGGQLNRKDLETITGLQSSALSACITLLRSFGCVRREGGGHKGINICLEKEQTEELIKGLLEMPEPDKAPRPKSKRKSDPETLERENEYRELVRKEIADLEKRKGPFNGTDLRCLEERGMDCGKPKFYLGDEGTTRILIKVGLEDELAARRKSGKRSAPSMDTAQAAERIPEDLDDNF